MWVTRYGRLSGALVVLEAVGTLLGQGLYGRLSARHSNHILIACWLFFGVVVGTAYRSSLIASLTVPKYPPRPETVQELVKVIERATIEPYGISYKNFFTKSEYAAFSALGRLMRVGVDIKDGLTDALKMKRAHVGGQQYLQLSVAQYFTRIDGTSPIYIGREIIIPSTSAWPIPHDAPFKPQLDSTVMAITEAESATRCQSVHTKNDTQ
ncbi:hypothetical protein O3P69_014472 [Scylla paramamosain]|uniref:Ionotropic glutamate receptor C-terminal domain-containing protein n=1 Tax=Scylla paramamosain TaxID=85552 RepID=A0AAW0TB98_SCYPA